MHGPIPRVEPDRGSRLGSGLLRIMSAMAGLAWCRFQKTDLTGHEPNRQTPLSRALPDPDKPDIGTLPSPGLVQCRTPLAPGLLVKLPKQQEDTTDFSWKSSGPARFHLFLSAVGVQVGARRRRGPTVHPWPSPAESSCAPDQTECCASPCMTSLPGAPVEPRWRPARHRRWATGATCSSQGSCVRDRR